jgi:hypothetical protein
LPEKEGIIKKIEINRNPILVKIDDGTSNGTDILLSPSEYRRYKKTKKLKLGNKIRVSLLKHPKDKEKKSFQITKAVFL